MEDLGNLVGELFVEKNSFVNLRDFIYQNDFAKTDAFLKKTEDSFQRIISDLDSVVMKMRMQKVKTLFQRFPRVVRDLSKKLEKEVDLVFSGEDTEIDNRILGAVTDPMMHLVRNAMDHGVEIPAKREKAGKNRKGTIQLSARNMDNRIVIEIFDDGNGIDPAVIKKKAVEKGVITEQEADILTDPQARELIFHPGFSTAEQVTEVSGRGVGMDVVLDNIRKVNGSIALESETGRYSRVTLTLPTTISVSRGLKVCFGRDIYLLPMDSVVKMIAIEAKNVHRTPNSVFVETGGAVYPVLPLNSSMGYRSPVDSPNEFINLILVKGEKKKACVAVDRIVGIEDIVVKPLPPISSGVKDFYSGCSILSDGSVVLIINIDNYLNRGML
jgi:two-component system chemotaxis sensor kinase CheA